METDPQHLLKSHIPWYRTRKFWVLFYLFILILSFSFTLSIKDGGSLYKLSDIIILISTATGGFFLQLITLNIFGQTNPFIAPIVHFCLIGYLCFKTFEKPIVKIKYPIFILALLLSSLYITFEFTKNFY